MPLLPPLPLLPKTAYESCRGIASLAVCALSLVSISAAGCGGGSSSSVLPGISTGTPNPAPEIPETAAFRLVFVPEYRDIYGPIDSRVIESRAQLDQFLDRAAALSSGYDEAPFLTALKGADIDFEREALVLFSYVVGSSGIRVTLDPPELQGETLVSTIRTSKFGGGTADQAPYTYALAVSRAAVKEVRVAVADANARPGEPPASINLRIGE